MGCLVSLLSADASGASKRKVYKMTNKEKIELKERMDRLDYWCNLSMRMLIDNKGISQKKALIELRERQQTKEGS